MAVQDDDMMFVSYPTRGKTFFSRFAVLRIKGAAALFSVTNFVGTRAANDPALAGRLDQIASDKIARFGLVDPDLLENRNVFVVESKPQMLIPFVGWRGKITFSLQQCGTLYDAGMRIIDSKRKESLVVLNVDQFDDLDTAVRALMEFRSSFPEVPVIIGSTSFLRHDYSQERAAITDVSIRLPSSEVSLVPCSKVSMALAVNSAIRSRA